MWVGVRVAGVDWRVRWLDCIVGGVKMWVWGVWVGGWGEWLLLAMGYGSASNIILGLKICYFYLRAHLLNRS